MDKLRHHIIGTGRWGSWLAHRLHEIGHEVISLRNRSASSAKRLAKELGVSYSPNDFEKGVPFSDGDLIWCCVPDDELAGLNSSINKKNPKTHVVHCSGTSPLLDNASTGVFWPIQSFTTADVPDWSNLPIIVQASSSAFAKTLLEIATEVSGHLPKLVEQDEDRMRLHLGAVLTQNFSNLLWRLTEDVFAKADNAIDYQVLLPLAKNHLSKLAHRSPSELQTGPASRGDQQTLISHLELLKALPETKEIYTILSELIAQKES